MRKLSILLALVAGLFISEARADFTGKNAAGTTITFKNPVDCTSVVCVPMSAPYALAAVGTGWTSATSLNTTQSIMAAGYGAPAVLVQLNQTSTISGGAVTFQGTYDGTNWVSVPVAQLVNPNTLAPLTNPYTLVASTNQPFLILTQGYQQIRLLLSTVITGSATVTPQVTLLPYNPVIGALLNPLSAGSAVIGKVGIDQTTPNVTNHVSTGPYPDGAVPYTATATGTTGATTATLAGASSVTTYLCGFSIRANATAAATGNATVTGVITATLNYTQWTAPLASGIGVVEQIFSPCIPASGTNQSIAVVSAAPGSGGVVSVTAWGYKL